jgi:hypothetical protein
MDGIKPIPHKKLSLVLLIQRGTTGVEPGEGYQEPVEITGQTFGTAAYVLVDKAVHKACV